MVRWIPANIRAWFTSRAAGRSGVGASLLFALLAVPIILACGQTPHVLSQAPAHDVSLAISITDLRAVSSNVLVQSTVMVVGVRGPVILTSSHMLTCNGVSLSLMSGGRVLVPRQPPGGAYTFVYTDEHGQRTTLVVPVPRGAFAITSPAAGATIILPRQRSFGPAPTATGSAFTTSDSDLTALAAEDATPVPPATPTPSATPVPSGSPTPVGQVRPPQLVSQPPVLIRYTIPAVPSNAIATVQARAYCGHDGAPTCAGNIFGPTVTASGAYALTDADVAPGYGFEAFGPGPGELAATLTVGWALPPSGFNAAHVTFNEDATVLITWAR